MTKEAGTDPVSLARRLYAVTTSGNAEELEDLLAADVVDHGVGGADTEPIRGVTAMREDVLAFRRSFPDAQILVDDAFASVAGDRVAVRWTITGTHQGMFQGIPATGRTVTMSGVDVLRMHGGRIVERWGCSDELGLLQQLVDRREGERRAADEDAAARSERRRSGRRQTDPALGS